MRDPKITPVKSSEENWQFAVNIRSRWDRVTGFTVASQFSPTINFIYKPRADTLNSRRVRAQFSGAQFPERPARHGKIVRRNNGRDGYKSRGEHVPVRETDYTWDVGFTRQLGPHLQYAQDNYLRIDRHYLDEGQFGFVPMDAPFNYVRGYGGGTEHSLTYNLENLALRLNAFVAREQNIGVASGQYNFPPDELSYIDRHYIVLDHTPLLGASGGPAYRWNDYQFTFDGLLRSGLRGGFANQTQLPKVWQINLSAAKDFLVPGLGKFTNRIILLNIFDRTQPDSSGQRYRSFPGSLWAEDRGLRRANDTLNRALSRLG